MGFDLETFKADYEKWVEENAQDFHAGNIKKAIKSYPLVTPESVPWTPFKGNPSEKTFALVTSGGLYLKGSQPAFKTESIHGDPSFRAIPKAANLDDLGIVHAHYDHALADQDINTIFPLQRFVELEKEKIIGKLADTNYSFSYVNDVVTFVTKTVPKVIEQLKAEGVDALFLVPV